MQDTTNPWADAANKGVSALYKHYMSQPSADEMQTMQFQNELLGARRDTQRMQQRKLGLEADGLQMRNSAPSRIKDVMSQYLNAAPVNSGGTMGHAPADAPMSVRNNNPLNIRPVGASEGFNGYETPEEGFNAARQDLMAKISGNSSAMASKFGDAYQPTLSNLINTWAPPTENDTNNYLDFVASKTGFTPDHVLQEADLEALIPAMAQMEGGQAAMDYFYGDQQQPQPDNTQRYNEYMPDLVENAMMAAIQNPAQGADVLQMLGGAMQLPPEQMANIQAGAGTNYANTQMGFEQDLNNPEPYTLSPGARRFDADNNQVAYAPPKQGRGSSVTLPDGTIVDIDGGTGQTAIGRSATNKAQEQQVEGAKFNRMINYARQIASEDAGNFGVAGFTKGKLQDTAMLLNGVSESLGFDKPKEAFNEMVRRETNNKELSAETLTSLYDPRLNALQQAANLMVYQAASALASQSGRSVSDKDVKMFRSIVGDPQSFFMNQQKFMSNLDAMQEFLAIQQGVLNDATGGDVVGQEYITPDPTRFGDQPSIPDVDSMSEAELDAILAGG